MASAASSRGAAGPRAFSCIEEVGACERDAGYASLSKAAPADFMQSTRPLSATYASANLSSISPYCTRYGSRSATPNSKLTPGSGCFSGSTLSKALNKMARSLPTTKYPLKSLWRRDRAKRVKQRAISVASASGCLRSKVDARVRRASESSPTTIG